MRVLNSAVPKLLLELMQLLDTYRVKDLIVVYHKFHRGKKQAPMVVQSSPNETK